MIGKYKKLKQDFENLEKEYSREVAKNLDLQYEYDNLKADYTNESTQRAEIERLHENTRRLKHDMKNHISTVNILASQGKCSEIYDYTSDLINDNSYINKTFIFTGNDLLDAVVNMKFSIAENLGI